MANSHRVSILPGDGIGPEIVEATIGGWGMCPAANIGEKLA
jgi:isocitrate/isopropylmalate dehydrogenase